MEHGHCGGCWFWEPPQQYAYEDETDGAGRCHRMPPTIGRKDGERQWPPTDADDWCGEYRPKAARHAMSPR